MKKFLYIAVIFSSFCSAGEPDYKLHEQCIYPTVIIQGQFAGTGVIVKSEAVASEHKNIVYSVCHIFSGEAHKVYVPVYKLSELKTYNEYPLTLDKTDREKDIAIAHFFSKEKLFSAKLNHNPRLYLGNEVIKVGCGNIEEPRLDYGRITAIKTNKGENLPDQSIRTSLFTIPGDSGAGIFHEYELIGVMSCVKVGQNCISFIVPLGVGFK